MFAFDSVTVSVEVPFGAIGFGLKFFVTVGGESTSSVAVAGPGFEPPFAVVSAPMITMLLYEFAAALVTFTVTVQLPAAGMVPPVSATELPPFAAVAVPPHVVATFDGVALTSPPGYVSVNAALVSGVEFELLNVIVSVDVPLTGMDVGANAFEIVGRLSTVNVAVPPPKLVPSEPLTFPVVLI